MGAWLGALFSGLAGLITQWLANKTVFATAVVAGFLALTTAFTAAMGAIASTVSGSLPSWAIGVGYLIPDNAAACFSAIVSARIARWIYDYHKEVLKTAAQV